MIAIITRTKTMTTPTTGAQHLARPLFAYALTGNPILVAFVVGMNAFPRIFTGPITGYLTDRIGRKPIMWTGAGALLVLPIPLFQMMHGADYVMTFVASVSYVMMSQM